MKQTSYRGFRRIPVTTRGLSMAYAKLAKLLAYCAVCGLISVDHRHINDQSILIYRMICDNKFKHDCLLLAVRRTLRNNTDWE
jgi:hypothetical protein